MPAPQADSSLIAATAQVHGLELVTLNTKHFPMFDDLKHPFQL